MTAHLITHKAEDLPTPLLHGINAIDPNTAAGIKAVSHMVREGKLVLQPLEEGETPYVHEPYNNVSKYGVPDDKWYNRVKVKVPLKTLPEKHLAKLRKKS